MRARFLSVAAIELADAITQYESIDPRLARRFVTEIEAALERVKENPRAWAPVGAGLRRCRTNRFPYALIYGIEDGDVLVVAFPNLHRDPKHWRDRIVR